MSVKVTMNLTDKDCENADYIHDTLSCRTKAQAVSIALSLTRYIVNARSKGDVLQVRQPDGSVVKVLMAEIENAFSDSTAGVGSEQADVG